MQLNYSITFLQDKLGHNKVVKTLFDHGMATGFLMIVLKKSIHDRHDGFTDLLREKMGINQEAIGTVYILHYFINCSVARSKALCEASSTSEVTVTGSAIPHNRDRHLWGSCPRACRLAHLNRHHPTPSMRHPCMFLGKFFITGFLWYISTKRQLL